MPPFSPSQGGIGESFERDYALTLVGIPQVIRRPAIQKNNFKLKPITLQSIQNIQFMGLPNEDPNRQISNFLEVCDTVQYNGVNDGAICLRLFPFSLKKQNEALAKFRTSQLHHYLG